MKHILLLLALLASVATAQAQQSNDDLVAKGQMSNDAYAKAETAKLVQDLNLSQAQAKEAYVIFERKARNLQDIQQHLGEPELYAQKLLVVDEHTQDNIRLLLNPAQLKVVQEREMKARFARAQAEQEEMNNLKYGNPEGYQERIRQGGN